MSVIRHYVMTVKSEAITDFPKVLAALGEALKAVPGSNGVELAQDAEKPERFVFREFWDSIEAHKGSASRLPRAAITPIIGALAGPMDGSYLTPVDL